MPIWAQVLCNTSIWSLQDTGIAHGGVSTIAPQTYSLQTVNEKSGRAVMAKALAEETRAEQLRNHIIPSAAPHESTCKRCCGFIVNDFFCIGEMEFATQRCVQCGEIVDPVILRNRRIKPEPVTTQPAGERGQNDRATNGRGRFALQTHGIGFHCARSLEGQIQHK